MLGGVNLMGEGFKGVTSLTGHAGLAEVVAAVDFSVNPMDSAAGFWDASVPRLSDAVEAGECGEEAGVEVDDSAGKSVKQRRLDHAHEAGEDDEVDFHGLKVVSPGLLALGGELSLEGTGIEKAGWHAVLRAQLQHLTGRDVAPESDHLGLAEATFGLGTEDCVGVRAATRTKEGDAHDGKVSAWAIACKRIFEFRL
jgi:hypothetical protein